MGAQAFPSPFAPPRAVPPARLAGGGGDSQHVRLRLVLGGAGAGLRGEGRGVLRVRDGPECRREGRWGVAPKLQGMPPPSSPLPHRQDCWLSRWGQFVARYSIDGASPLTPAEAASIPSTEAWLASVYWASTTILTGGWLAGRGRGGARERSDVPWCRAGQCCTLSHALARASPLSLSLSPSLSLSSPLSSLSHFLRLSPFCSRQPTSWLRRHSAVEPG